MEECGIDQNCFEGYIYRGEGNANLVIALPSTRNVLRFRKIVSITHAAGRERVNFERQYYRGIISKFLNYFVKEPEFVHCHPRCVPNWNQFVEPYRPGHRRHKNLYEEYAMKLPDYSLLPIHLEGKLSMKKSTFCVEIKPKQGFVPMEDRKFSRCPYCINQFYKVTKMTISRPSRYCPCDLFSGDRSRLQRAIHALMESPQNNFIIFKNGVRAWGEGNERSELEQLLLYECFSDNSSTNIERHFEDLNCLISLALLRNFPVGEEGEEEDQPSMIVDPINETKEITVHAGSYEIEAEIIPEVKINIPTRDEICQFPENNLPRGSVLERIFRMQQLHQANFKDVYNIYSKYSKFLHDQMIYSTTTDNIKLDCELSMEKIQILRNYLLFVTARDCSILLAFKELHLNDVNNIPKSHVIWLPQRQKYFSFNIGITDVDPKNLQRIEKHQQRNIRDLNIIMQNFSTICYGYKDE